MHADLGGLHRIELVMDGRRRAGKVVDLIHLDIERETDIVAQQLKTWMVQQMGNLGTPAGIEVVDTQHFMPGLDQARTEMGADKPGAAGHQNALRRGCG